MVLASGGCLPGENADQGNSAAKLTSASEPASKDIHMCTLRSVDGLETDKIDLVVYWGQIGAEKTICLSQGAQTDAMDCGYDQSIRNGVYTFVTNQHRMPSLSRATIRPNGTEEYVAESGLPGHSGYNVTTYGGNCTAEGQS
jgi:hypothetical protein